jgi:TonB family protein
MMSGTLSQKFICIFGSVILTACSGMQSRSSKADNSPPKVLVRVLVKGDGTAAETKVVESSGSEKIDNIALDVAKRAKYRPFLKDGVPEDSWALIPVNVKAP